jgi:branched-chain amino acid transport system permease protein
MALILQLLANGIVNGVLFALLACGFGLVYRSIRVFHIAFGALFLIASYAFFGSANWLHLPLWAAMLLGILAGALSGWGIEQLLYRPFFLRKARPGVVMVASLGVLIIVENTLALLFGNETRTVPRGLASAIQLGSVRLTSVQLVQALVGILLLTGFSAATKKVRLFTAISALGDQPDLVPVLGLPLLRYRSTVLLLSSVLTAVPACMITLDVGMNPHMGMSYLLIAAVGALAGGLDRYSGWMLGGFLLAILQSFVAWSFSDRWMDLVTFSTLIIILMVRPTGLFGTTRRLEETTS